MDLQRLTSSHFRPPLNEISLLGKVTLANRSARALPVELTRNVPGNIHDAGGAEVEVLDDPSNPARKVRGGQPRVNRRTGSARLTWKVTLEPGEVREFPYAWHVFRE